MMNDNEHEVMNVKNELEVLKKDVNSNSISPDVVASKIHSMNNNAYHLAHINLDNDMYRNGVITKKLAKSINPQLNDNKHDWFEVYRPFGLDHDLIRPLDKFSILLPINEILLAIKIGNQRETEHSEDMEEVGDTTANLADC